MPPIVSVSVDLDEIGCYHQIHGLSLAGAEPYRTVYATATERLAELFDRLGIRATFFAVGEELDAEVGGPAMARLHNRGHEIANHTMGHRYDLLDLDTQERQAEIDGGVLAIERAIGVRPTGFRAPGYNVDDDLLALLEPAGASYDSSVFPCPPYYAAKAAAMAAMRVRGRRSKSLLGPPQVLRAPAEPYYVDGPFHKKAQVPSPLVELPVAVLPLLRLPFIGTAVTMAGPLGATAMAAAMRARRYVGFELHGIDALDATDTGLAPLEPHQPDVRIPATKKLAAIGAAIKALGRLGASFETCHGAAERFRQSG